MPEVANISVENDDPIMIVVPSEHREGVRGATPPLLPLRQGGRGFSRDVKAFKSENGFSR
jgi:hypothetical protein